jgi:DNA-directed RNA polymerase specialized sigma24 family protein
MPTDQSTILTALLRGVADRDRDAFAAFYATLAPALWREVIDGGLSAMDADAVIATTFIEVWQMASVHIGNDMQIVDWIRRSVGRRCAERRYRMRECAPDAGRAPAGDPGWQHTAVRYDESAKRAITELLSGRAPVGRELTGPAPGGQPPHGRPAPTGAVPVPAAPFSDPPTTYRPRRADLGAAAVFGHRRAGTNPAERPNG